MEFSDCVPFQEALRIVQAQLSGQTGVIEELPLAECLGRTTAVNLVTQEDLPPFSRSTVDGYAVKSGDTFGAAEGIPVLLDLVGEVLMGQAAQMNPQSGQAVAIPTGGMLPAGTDTVVMLEYTERPDSESLLILKAAAPGENLIVKGEDFRAGQIILCQGQVITPQAVGMLAACGYSRIPVWTKPKVAILSTGDEVVDIDCPTVNGQIRDINSYALAALVEQMGCRAKRYGIVPDRYETLQQTLSQALADSQLVLISGGSSVGARDHTVKVMQSFAQSQVLFHGVAVKPGKPTIFGMVKNVPVFGLPGHPVSALTIFYILVKNALRLILGQELDTKPPIPARVTRNVASAPGRDDFIRVKLIRRNGEYWAEPIFGKSGLMSTLLQADGLVAIPQGKSGLYGEEWVEVQRFE